MRLLALIDGEHYPPLVRSVLDEVPGEVVAAVFLGGTEKVGSGDPSEIYGVPTMTGPDREATLAEAIERYRPDQVLDLSDEPVVTSADRFKLATVALLRGVPYVGSDFEFRPTTMEAIVTKPSIRVIASGKRTGKTAVAGALARHAASVGWSPLIIAMGRGGPQPPEVLEADHDLSVEALIALADSGRHAASDYIEDAITSRVTTIGCRRVGGGMAGQVYASNVAQGARMAEERHEDLVILEGSGAAIPPVQASAGLMVLPATAGYDAVHSYLVPYRVLLADLVVVTMGEDSGAADLVLRAVREVAPEAEAIPTVFRPKPLEDVSGCRVFFCSTAPLRVSGLLRTHLEEAHGCEVVGMSHSLADRPRLEQELSEAPEFDVLITEVKAAGVDVAARIASRTGSRIVFADNELVGDGVKEAFDRLIEQAKHNT